MNLWDSKTYIGDLESGLQRVNVEALRGKRLLISGATGLIGSAVVDLLLMANRRYAADITVYAASRSENKVRSRFPGGENFGLRPVVYDATRPVEFDFPVDCIIHGASNASPDIYLKEPVDTMLSNIVGVQHLLNYAVQHGAEKFVYISSSEVYGKQEHGQPMREDCYGLVDILNLRSVYPVGKQAAETMCVAYVNQHDLNVSIVRPGHIYGPTAQRSDKRVSSAFVRQAAAGEDLVMKSAGTQLRSYCHCIDCATAILAVLLKGERGQAYNISNKDSVITIRQMSEIIAAAAGVQLLFELPSEQEKAAFNPMDNSSLNSTKLEALGWSGSFPAELGFDHSIKVLREIAE